MLLSEFIGTSIERSAVDLAKQRTKTLQALRIFLGERWSTTDLVCLFVPSFLGDFERFILTEYTPLDRYGRQMDETGLSAEELTANRLKRRNNIFLRLRGMVNEAVEAGRLPAMDPFAAMPDFAAKYRVNPPSCIATELRRLFKTESAKNRRTIHTYFLSLCLGGVDSESVATIARATEENSRMVTIPGRGVTLMCNDRLREMLLELKTEIESAPEGTDNFAQNMTAWVTETGAGLFAAGDLFIDWLRVAAQTKTVSRGDLMECIEAIYGCRLGDPTTAKVIGAVCNSLLDNIIPQKRIVKTSKWVVVMTTWPDTAQKLQDRIFGVGTCVTPTDAELARLLRGRTYCPCRTVSVKIDMPDGRRVLRYRADPRRSVLRNTLFVRADKDILQQFKRCFPDVWIMRRRGAKEYVSVEEGQIQLMKNVLDTFSSVEDVDLVFQPHPASDPDYNKGERVMLNHPDFDRQMAVIVSVDKERSSATSTYYIVYFSSSNGIRFHLSLPSTLIEPLIPRPLDS